MNRFFTAITLVALTVSMQATAMFRGSALTVASKVRAQQLSHAWPMRIVSTSTENNSSAQQAIKENNVALFKHRIKSSSELHKIKDDILLQKEEIKKKILVRDNRIKNCALVFGVSMPVMLGAVIAISEPFLYASAGTALSSAVAIVAIASNSSLDEQSENCDRMVELVDNQQVLNSLQKLESMHNSSNDPALAEIAAIKQALKIK